MFGAGIKAQWAVAPNAQPKTDIGWDIYPRALCDVLKRIHVISGDIPIEITENGAADNALPDKYGRIDDQMRIRYLEGHLKAMHEAINAGVPVRAYHYWSLLDNFEWAEGYSQRFGMIFVEYENNRRRIVKESGYWFRRVAEQNALAVL